MNNLVKSLICGVVLVLPTLVFAAPSPSPSPSNSGLCLVPGQCVSPSPSPSPSATWSGLIKGVYAPCGTADSGQIYINLRAVNSEETKNFNIPASVANYESLLNLDNDKRNIMVTVNYNPSSNPVSSASCGVPYSGFAVTGLSSTVVDGVCLMPESSCPFKPSTAH